MKNNNKTPPNQNNKSQVGCALVHSFRDAILMESVAPLIPLLLWGRTYGKRMWIRRLFTSWQIHRKQRGREWELAAASRAHLYWSNSSYSPPPPKAFRAFSTGSATWEPTIHKMPGYWDNSDSSHNREFIYRVACVSHWYIGAMKYTSSYFSWGVCVCVW